MAQSCTGPIPSLLREVSLESVDQRIIRVGVTRITHNQIQSTTKHAITASEMPSRKNVLEASTHAIRARDAAAIKQICGEIKSSNARKSNGADLAEGVVVRPIGGRPYASSNCQPVESVHGNPKVLRLRTRDI